VLATQQTTQEEIRPGRPPPAPTSDAWRGLSPRRRPPVLISRPRRHRPEADLHTAHGGGGGSGFDSRNAHPIPVERAQRSDP